VRHNVTPRARIVFRYQDALNHQCKDEDMDLQKCYCSVFVSYGPSQECGIVQDNDAKQCARKPRAPFWCRWKTKSWS